MPARARRVRRACVLLPGVAVAALLALAPVPAFAQPKEPIPRFVADVQGALPKLPTDPSIATARGLDGGSLSAWGPGFNLAAHAFPLRTRWITFGIGANYQWTRGTWSPEIPDDAASDYDPGPSVVSRFTSFAPQVSFAFGHRRGFSYVSGGIGTSLFTVSRDDLPDEEGESVKTINYGGGGRWFVKDHLAFSFDLRIYAANPVVASDLTAGHPRLNIVVLNLGVSIQ